METENTDITEEVKEIPKPKFYAFDQSKNYKKFIQKAKYGDIVEKTTKEWMSFDYNKKTVKISFEFQFGYDFDDGFFCTNITHLKTSRKIDEETENEMLFHIKKRFPDLHHLSY